VPLAFLARARILIARRMHGAQVWVLRLLCLMLLSAAYCCSQGNLGRFVRLVAGLLQGSRWFRLHAAQLASMRHVLLCILLLLLLLLWLLLLHLLLLLSLLLSASITSN
jgi:hypothetical protein